MRQQSGELGSGWQGFNGGPGACWVDPERVRSEHGAGNIFMGGASDYTAARGEGVARAESSTEEWMWAEPLAV